MISYEVCSLSRHQHSQRALHSSYAMLWVLTKQNTVSTLFDHLLEGRLSGSLSNSETQCQRLWSDIRIAMFSSTYCLGVAGHIREVLAPQKWAQLLVVQSMQPSCSEMCNVGHQRCQRRFEPSISRAEGKLKESNSREMGLRLSELASDWTRFRWLQRHSN